MALPLALPSLLPARARFSQAKLPQSLRAGTSVGAFHGARCRSSRLRLSAASGDDAQNGGAFSSSPAHRLKCRNILHITFITWRYRRAESAGGPDPLAANFAEELKRRGISETDGAAASAKVF